MTDKGIEIAREGEGDPRKQRRQRQCGRGGEREREIQRQRQSRAERGEYQCRSFHGAEAALEEGHVRLVERIHVCGAGG